MRTIELEDKQYEVVDNYESLLIIDQEEEYEKGEDIRVVLIEKGEITHANLALVKSVNYEVDFPKTTRYIAIERKPRTLMWSRRVHENK